MTQLRGKLLREKKGSVLVKGAGLGRPAKNKAGFTQPFRPTTGAIQKGK